MVYDYAGANMLVNRYLIKHDGKTYELPQETFMAISMMLALNEKEGETRVEIVKEFYPNFKNFVKDFYNKQAGLNNLEPPEF